MARSYVTIDVDVYMDEFDDDILIEELEDRGYQVKHYEDVPEELTELEINAIVGMFEDSKPGTVGNEIYEKLRKR